MGKLTLSGRKAEHSLNVSNHWAWSPGGELQVNLFNNSEGTWRKIAEVETIFRFKGLNEC